MSNANENQKPENQPTEERKKITLLQPESGNTAYTADADTDIVLGFVTGDATMTKSGDEKDLIFTFKDADGNVISTITITGFYEVYDKDNLPTFFIPGDTPDSPIELTAEAFFTGNDDLMPASGNEQSPLSDHPGTDPIDPSLLGGTGDGLGGLNTQRVIPVDPPQVIDINPADAPGDGGDGGEGVDQPASDFNDLPVADVFSFSELFDKLEFESSDTSVGSDRPKPPIYYNEDNFVDDLKSYLDNKDFDNFESFLKSTYSGATDNELKQILDIYNKLQAKYEFDNNILDTLETYYKSLDSSGKLIDIYSDDALVVRNYDFTDAFNTDHDYGNDGAATNNSLVTSYALSFAGDATDQLGSGITVGKDDEQADIYLYEEDGSIVGRTNDGKVYFKFSVDENGQIIVTEYKSTNGGILSNDAKILLTRTDVITDGNGDTSRDSASIEIVTDNISIGNTKIIKNLNKDGTTGDDIYYSSDVVTNTKLNTDAGDDFLKIVSESAGIHSSKENKNSTINTGQDDDTVIVDAKVNAMISQVKNSVSTINTGGDDDTVTLAAGNHTMHAGGSGKNIINTGDDADSVTLDAGKIAMNAVNNGKNEINTGADNDKVSITADNYAMSADGNNSQNNIFLEDGDDDLRIVGDFRATSNGTNKISGGEDDDFIFISGQFEASGGGTNIINGGKDNDLIKLTASGITFEDVLTVNGGDGNSDGSTNDIDILLTGVDNLQAVKDGLTAGAITNIEIAIAGDVKGESVAEVLNELGLDKDGDGKIETIELEGWTSDKTSKTYNGQDYQEYTRGSGEDQVTLLIQTGSIA